MRRMVIIMLVLFSSAAFAWEVPTIIDFQGKLTDNNNNPQAGSFNMTFKIYNQSSGGALLWQENKLVNVTSGLFSTLLGSNIAINLTFGEDYYIEMVVSGETFSPRYRVATAPYAFRANITTTAIAGTTTEVSFTVNSITGQTANITVWKNSTGAIMAYMNTSGFFNVSGGIPCTAIRGGDGDFCQDENSTGGGLSDNTTLTALIGQKANQTEFANTNLTIYGILGQKLNLTGGILSGLLSILGINTANNLSLNVNNTLYVNASADRVGIGTASPSSKLDVSGTLTVEGVNVTGRIVSDNTTQNNWINSIDTRQTADNTTLAANISTTNTRVGNLEAKQSSDNTTLFANLGQKLNLTGGILSGLLSILNVSTTNNLSLNVSGALYVNGSREFVGIGTANPSSRLDVSGTLTVEGVNVTGRQVADNTTLGNKITTLQADNTTQANAIATLQSDNTTQAALLGQKLNLTGGTLSSLLTIANSSTSNNLSFNASGVLYTNQSGDTRQVGIGTSSPNQLLQVAGGNVNISSGNLWVTGTIIINGTPVGSGTAAGWSENTTTTTVYNDTPGIKVGIGTASPSAKLTVIGANTTNNLSLNINNTLYVNASADRVGIGTTAPNQRLQISSGNVNVSSGNVWIYGDLIINDTPYASTNVSILYGANASNTTTFIPAQISAAGNLMVSIDEGLGTGWSASAGLVFLQTASDRVGIGTSTPSGKLDLIGTNTANNISLLVNNTLYLNESGGGMIGIRTSSPSSVLQVSGNASISGTLLVNGVNVSGSQTADNSTLTALLGQKLNLTGGTLSGLLSITGNPSNIGNLSLSVNETLYVNQSVSSVGIGTTDPGPWRDSGTPALVLSSSGTGTRSTLILVGDPDATDENFGILTFTDVDTTNTNKRMASIIGRRGTDDNSGKLWFQVSNSGTQNNAMVIHHNGYVGIGTTSPGSVLSVAGNFSTTTGALLATSSGNVGIGTTSPGQLLHVSGGNMNISSGNLWITGALEVNGSSVTAGASSDNTTQAAHIGQKANQTEFANTNATIYGILGQKLNLTGGTLSGLLSITGNAANAGNLSLSVNSTLYANQSTSNVGIGTANPISKFHVVGNITLNGSLIPATAPSFTSRTPDTSGDVGRDAVILNGTDNLSFIVYRDASNSDLKAVKCGNTACSSGNTVTTLATTINGDTGLAGVANNNDTFPIIAYFADSATLTVIKCSNLACSSSSSTNVVTGGSGFRDGVSIGVGSDGLPAIAYYSGGADLNFIKCGNNACTSGNSIKTLDSEGSSGYFPYLKIGADDLPVIAFITHTNGNTTVFKCGNANCTSGNTTVDLFTGNGGTSGVPQNSIAIGTDGFPVIATYNASGGDLIVVKCGNAGCTSGNTLTVVESAGVVGSYPSIEIANDGRPIISYYDSTNGDLKITKCGNTSCSSGNVNITIDSSGDIGYFTGIIVQNDTFPMIAYFDVTNTDLKVAHCIDVNCTTSLGTPYAGGTDFGNTTHYANNIYGSYFYGKSTSVSSFDVAEDYEVDSPDVGIGEIVCTSIKSFVLTRCSKDKTSIVGVISTKPGVLLGEWEGQKPSSVKPVALVGRVPVKVSTENGAINIGDYIAISSQPGIGMRATHVGRTAGIALESFDGKFGSNCGAYKCGSILVAVKSGEGNIAQALKEMKEENDYMREQLNSLQSRLAALESNYNGKVKP